MFFSPPPPPHSSPSSPPLHPPRLGLLTATAFDLPNPPPPPPFLTPVMALIPQPPAISTLIGKGGMVGKRGRKPTRRNTVRSPIEQGGVGCIYEVLTSLRTWGRIHGSRRPSSDDSFHSPTVIPPSALGKPSIMKRYHRRRTCSHTSPRRSPTTVPLHDTRFVECR